LNKKLRAEKKWDEADKIRDKVIGMGYMIKDSAK